MLSVIRPTTAFRVAADIGYRTASVWGSSSRLSDWNRAVSEAEKLVGYSTSFLSLRCLLSDELSNVAMQMRKLVGTNHPLLKTARKLFYNGKQNLQTRGLLVLLMAKAAGPAVGETDCDEVMVSGIYQSQRTLAEITEMIHTASLIHKGIVNITPFGMESAPVSSNSKRTVTEDLEFGNKMAVLSGDFLLANASTSLAGLNNTKVVEMISVAIGDLMRAEFTRLRDSHGSAILPDDGATVEDWEQQTFLSSGSLLARSCAAALTLARHSEAMQQKAYEFGKQIAFAYQISEELRQIVNADESANGLNVASAPVILYTNSDRCDSSYRRMLSKPTSSTKNLIKLVLEDSSVLREARRLRDMYGQRALEALEVLNKSEARRALQNIVRATVTV